MKVYFFKKLSSPSLLLFFLISLNSLKGELINADVMRIGVFNSVSNGNYLNLVSEQNVLEYLAKQPERSIRRSAKKLQNNDVEYKEVFIDPTRGSLLTKLIDRAGFLERINQGGFVGYVILIILAAGIAMGVIQFLFLRNESTTINNELETGNYSDSSTLGKLNKIYNQHAGDNPEELEAQLEQITKQHNEALAFANQRKEQALTLNGAILALKELIDGEAPAEEEESEVEADNPCATGNCPVN